MAVRIFLCSRCGHRMRLGGARCGWCHQRKKGWQRPWFYLWSGGLIVLIAAWLLLSV